MTGRAAGYCAGYSAPGYMSPAPGGGFGYGRGRGFGRGMGRGFGRAWAGQGMQPYGYSPYGYAPYPPAAPPIYPPVGAAPSREQELEMLGAQAQGIEQTLGDIRKRISELEAEEE